MNIRPESRVDELIDRWPIIWPFGAVGLGGIIVGGIIAAISTPADLAKGPWAAAFLVLVTGVAQIGLGLCQAWLAHDPPARRTVLWQLASWNLGGACTIIGTVAHVQGVTAIGSVLVMVSLVQFLFGVGRTDKGPKWALTTFRALVILIAASAPIGLIIGITKGH